MEEDQWRGNMFLSLMTPHFWFLCYTLIDLKVLKLEILDQWDPWLDFFHLWEPEIMYIKVYICVTMCLLCWRIDAFELWCWIRLLRVPWIARRSNQSILKDISPEYSLERLIMKLKFQYFCHLMQRDHSLEKTLAGKDWRQKEKRAADNVMAR